MDVNLMFGDVFSLMPKIIKLNFSLCLGAASKVILALIL
jgi:hypothetical protein